MSDAPLVFTPRPADPPPPSTIGVVGWMRANLFSSVPNAILTFLGAYIFYVVVYAIIDWALIKAVWEAENRRQCLDMVGRSGACWPGVAAWIPNLIYGLYPKDQVWRINTGFLILIAWAVPLWLPRVKSKVAIGLSLVLLYPLLVSYFFHGGAQTLVWTALIALGGAAFLWVWLTTLAEMRFGLGFGALVARLAGAADDERARRIGWGALAALYVLALLIVSQLSFVEVQTRLWGGLFLTLVISGIGIAFSLPAGVLLALGRRSQMPLIRVFCVTFIELFRSVPLITILFMFNTMLPLFLPQGVEVNRLLRAIVAVCLFASAYMAEIVRGGLQAIPKGQYEAAAAMGLGFWQSTSLIILPQALRIMIPSIVGNFIGLFKDTTLVSIIGLFDLLSMSRAVGEDTRWLGLFIEPFFFITLIYFVFCFLMSQYSLNLERRLGEGQRR
ncbi:amino acid ABC transporter permease [Falsiroseomonas sp.]|uniref:amino acid ABC transporter permease n=1 Tax=Falsiroseomonas sp. TaxID=2870721 RepID=UPI0027159135|nr:amino acid ABC transporter permease [Falsiroseomonas sp.]MDO9502182.1 amino acid ABC transporter permease [Falsiroseomonas sp.]MDP3415242.1 amino acid ABC transporter permease [Falsiroseomonas sp.]